QAKASGATTQQGSDAYIVQSQYDLAGRVTDTKDVTVSPTSPRAETKYVYDDAGRVIDTKIYERSSGGALTQKSHTTQTYNSLLTTIQDNRNVVTAVKHEFSADGFEV